MFLRHVFAKGVAFMNDDSVARFWDKYIEKTISYGISGKVVRWYVRYAERYIDAHSHIRLVQHLPEHKHIDQYLKEKGRSSRLEDWQFKQLIMSIKILFLEMTNVEWARSYDWEDWFAKADMLEDGHASMTRDYQKVDIDSIEKGLLARNKNEKSLFAKVYRQHAQYIRQLIIEIRMMQYSIRTEQAYVHWFLHFVSFNEIKIQKT